MCRTVLFDFVRQLDSAQCYFRIPERLEPQHRITSLLHLSVILLNHVIQVLVGPDECLSVQDAFGLQFGDSLMRRPAAVERDLLRRLVTTDRFFEEAYGSRFIPIFSSAGNRLSGLAYRPRGRDSAIDPSL